MSDYRLKRWPGKLKATIERLERMKMHSCVTDRMQDSLDTAILALRRVWDEVDIALENKRG